MTMINVINQIAKNDETAHALTLVLLGQKKCLAVNTNIYFHTTYIMMNLFDHDFMIIIYDQR